MKNYLKYWLCLAILSTLASPAAAHSGAAAGAIMVLFFSAAIAVVVFTIVVIVCGIKRYSGLKIFGISLLFGVIAFIVAVSVWTLLIKNENQIAKEKAQSAVEDQREAEQSWRSNPLKEAACNGDVNKVKAALSNDNTNRRDIRRAFEDCAVEQSNIEVADLLLDRMFRPDFTQDKVAHCAYLAPVFRQIGKKIDLGVLMLFAKRKLDLDCREGVRSIPSWWSEIQKIDVVSDPNYSVYLDYLQKQGVDLYVDLGGRNLLSYAFEYGDTDTIELMLNEKSSPFALSPQSSYWTPLQYWILRRHAYQAASQQATTRPILPLSEQDRAKIQAQLRELTPDEANMLNGVGQRFSDWGTMPDGGAALFHYLLQRGAKLHIPNQYGVGIFHARMPFYPEMTKELDQLNNAQVRELACPTDLNGVVKLPLYAQAKIHQNLSILNYLDKRKLSAC
jgi:hypothetical protein